MHVQHVQPHRACAGLICLRAGGPAPQFHAEVHFRKIRLFPRSLRWFFPHKSLHFGEALHAVRQAGAGYISSLSKSLLVIAWRAHYARRGCEWTLPCCVSCLNQSIIWFRAAAVCCRPACAVLAHNVPAGCNGSGAVGAVGAVGVPHGERSCRAVTDGMSMRVPLPCMKSSNGSHQFRMVRAARARDLPIRMVRAARARDLPIRMVRAARARDLPNQMRPFGSQTWPPSRRTALHAARQSRRRSGICTPRLPRSAGRGPR